MDRGDRNGETTSNDEAATATAPGAAPPDPSSDASTDASTDGAGRSLPARDPTTARLLSRVAVGTRLAVYWSHYRRYYFGVVATACANTALWLADA